MWGEIGLNHSNCNALLVVGHGTRNPQGLRECRQLLAQIARNLPDAIVEGCFLELADPDIPTVMQQLAERGVQHVVVMPLLLFESGHAKRDIPRAASQAAQRLGLNLRFASALVDHPQILELSAQRFRDAARLKDINPRDTLWVFVGRGSRDPAAQDQFHDFLADRQQITPVAESRGAFLAMATPRLETVMEEAIKSPLKWVVVQPHLLFAGELLERLQRMVSTQDELRVRQQWLVTEHLGYSPIVAAAVTDRFYEALASAEVRCENP